MKLSHNARVTRDLPRGQSIGARTKRKMIQAEAARVLGVNQPKVSALKGYKLEGFSVERLMHFVTALGQDVVIEIRPRAKTKSAGRVRVVGAA
jgi:hypothetical protein